VKKPSKPTANAARKQAQGTDVAALEAFEGIIAKGKPGPATAKPSKASGEETLGRKAKGKAAPSESGGEESRRFAEVVRKMRRLQELSQEQLAEKAGLHRNFVGAFERGQMSVSLENAERLARALGVRLKDLL
jgi:ribosome-binding protein aMBF1 (putative translation factor)